MCRERGTFHDLSVRRSLDRGRFSSIDGPIPIPIKLTSPTMSTIVVRVTTTAVTEHADVQCSCPRNELANMMKLAETSYLTNGLHALVEALIYSMP